MIEKNLKKQDQFKDMENQLENNKDWKFIRSSHSSISKEVGSVTIGTSSNEEIEINFNQSSNIKSLDEAISTGLKIINLLNKNEDGNQSK